MLMPVYERRFFMATLHNELSDAVERQNEGVGNSVSTGKGTRSTRISGETLKHKITSGEIHTD